MEKYIYFDANAQNANVFMNNVSKWYLNRQ